MLLYSYAILILICQKLQMVPKIQDIFKSFKEFKKMLIGCMAL